MTQSASDSFRNTLRYQGQDYRFAPTYVRKRDPISPTNQSPDTRPPEQQGYYPITSLWTNITDSRVWMLVNITNNLANWVQISGGGGGGGIQSLTTPNVTVFPNMAGDISFASADGTVTITGDAGTNSIDLSAVPVFNTLNFHLVEENTDVFPLNSVVNLDSSDSTVTITRTNGNTIDFTVAGAANTFLGLRADTNATNVDPDPAVGVLQNRILFASASNTVDIKGFPGTHTIDLFVPGAIDDISVDFNSAGAPNGSVFIYNNNLKVFGNAPTKGTQGIVTQSIQTTDPNDTLYIKYVDGRVTTVDDTPTTVNTSALTNDSSFTISAQVTAFDPVSKKSFGGRCLVVGRNNAGTVSITSILENVSSGIAPLDACSFYFEPSGNLLLFRVVGIPATTIDWHAIIPNIATTP